jgi:hypothetical protein
VRADLDRLLRDATLVTIALAIALGYSLLNLAGAIGETVTTFLSPQDRGSGFGNAFAQPLTWWIGRHPLTFSRLLPSAVQSALVLIVAAAVYARHRRAQA